MSDGLSTKRMADHFNGFLYDKVDITRDMIFDLISKHIGDVDKSYINVEELTDSIYQRLPRKESLNVLYNYTSDHCVAKMSFHPDFNKLASRIAIERLHKCTYDNILDIANTLYFDVDVTGQHSPSISQEVYKIMVKHHDKIQEMIDYNRDNLFDYFGIKTLEKAYLFRVYHNKQPYIIERPQHMFMRTAIGIHGQNLKAVFETYDLLSNRYFTHASPTYFQAGTNRPQLSSCFLLPMEDSIKSIYGKTMKSCAYISQHAGGIGVHVSAVRARGSVIRSVKGQTEGIITWCKELDSLAKSVNQGGKRNGSIAVYIEPWHSDIFDFCELRLDTGSEKMRARDLFLALWVPDLFMKRVEEDGVWSLMCPDACPNLQLVYGDEFDKLYTKYETEKKFTKQIKARELWNHILTCQIESGFPYMLYKDHANRKSNQKNLGTIRSSNLCVHGDTQILTSEGYYDIKSLENKKVKVWNGHEWSKVTIKKTGTNKNLIRVTLSNGSYLDCTPEHKFYKSVNNKSLELSADQLKMGDKLIKLTLPKIINYDENDDWKYSYTHGFFCGDGTYYDNYSNTIKYPKAYLYGNKKNLLKYLDYESYTYNKSIDRYDIVLPKDLDEKFKVPLLANTNVRLEWLAGLCDADGTIARNGTNESIQITNINHQFLVDIRYMLHTLGIESKITLNKRERMEKLPDGKGGHKLFKCQKIWRLLISSSGVYKLLKHGFNPKRLNIILRKPQRNAEQFPIIESITQSFQNVDTYCFTESKRHMGVFNGILTGQCAEIVEYSSETEHAVCNLVSICLPRFIKDNNGRKTYDHEKLLEVCRVSTRNLNKIIDRNYYPTKQAKYSNLKHRPIGIGVQGLADVYNLMGYPFDSDQARDLNKRIFETIYFGCLSETKEIAKKHGRYETFQGSPFSRGEFQFHLWGLKNEDLLMGYDWDKLQQEVMQYGTRNSLLTALMPTASTSQIMGNYEGFEPYMTNIFVRTTLAGEFIVINEHLLKTLLELNIWNEDIRKLIILNNGSIQKIECIPQDIKDIYKTAFELKLKSILQQAVERGPFIDQSQSMNLFMEKPNFGKLTSAHFYGWKNGLKTGMYYLRTNPSVNPISFGIDINDIKRLTGSKNALEIIHESYKLNNIQEPPKTEDIEQEIEPPIKMCKYIIGKKAEGCEMCGS